MARFRIRNSLLWGTWCLWVYASSVFSQDNSPQTDTQREIKFTQGWVVSSGQGMQRGRSSLPTDPIEYAWIYDRLQMPDVDAQTSASADGLSPWKRIEADEQGGFGGRELFGGLLAVQVTVPESGIWLLDAQGHNSVRID